jgi:hypothetical protein
MTQGLSPEEYARATQQPGAAAALASQAPGEIAQSSSLAQGNGSDAPVLSAANDPNAPQIVDYWSGPATPTRWYLPDKVQYIDILPMNHGMRAQYNARTNKEMTMDRKTQSLKIKTDISGDTDALVEISSVDWFMFKQGVPVKFGNKGPGSPLMIWLKQAPPQLVDSLEKFIREANPWMDDELTVESIDEEIKRLYELRAEKEADAAKN